MEINPLRHFFSNINVFKSSIPNLIGFLNILFSGIAQFLLPPLIVHKTNPEILGLWHLMFQIFLFLELIDMGFRNASIRYFARAHIHQNQLPTVVKNIKIGLKLIGITYCLLALILILIIPTFYRLPATSYNDFKSALILLGFWGIFRFRMSLPLIRIYALNKISLYNLFNVLLGAGRPFCGAILFLFYESITSIIIGYILIELIVRLIATFFVSRIEIKGRFNYSLFKEMIGFGGETLIVNISTLITNYSGAFIIGYLADLKLVGVYQSSIALPFLLYRFAVVPFLNLYPYLLKLEEKNMYEKLFHSARSWHFFISIGSLLLFICIFFLNGYFVKLWVGDFFFAGDYFTFLYCLLLFISLARHNGYMVLQAKAKLKILTIAHILQVFVSLTIGTLLFKLYGLSGFAIGLIAGHLIPLIITQTIFFRYYNQRLLKND